MNNNTLETTIYNGSLGTIKDYTITSPLTVDNGWHSSQISYNSINPVDEVCKILQNEIYNILSNENKYTDEAKKIVDIINYLKKL